MKSFFVSLSMLAVPASFVTSASNSTIDPFSTAAYATDEEKKVGVLFSSFGDVDSPDEVESFVKTTLRDPDVAPIPPWLRPFVVRFGWERSKSDVLAEYAAIGNATHFRANSQIQADLVARNLSKLGFKAKGYTGFTMTGPHISEAMAKAQEDGVDDLVIFYQGAQWSKPTSYIVYREARKYLAAHPEWKVNSIMVRSFSDDKRFQDLLSDGIADRLDSEFATFNPDEVCIVLPAHGNPTIYNDQGDPAYNQMLRVFDSVRRRFPEYRVFHGFQNHSELPGSDWTQPAMDAVMGEVGKAPCSNVLINGRTSFTIDSLETLYDHAIGEVEELHRTAPEKRVFVEKMFNDDASFAKLMADIAVEALRGEGDIAKM